MFFKNFKITKIFFLITIVALISFFIQSKQAKAVDIKAFVCNGGGATIDGVIVEFRNLALGVASRACTTGPNGICNIPTRPGEGAPYEGPLPSGTYDVSVSKSGYTKNLAAPCATPLTYNTADLIAYLNVYLTPNPTTPPTTGTPSGGTYGLTNKPLKDIINGITEWLLGIVAGLTILYLVWGGIYYVTASGDESQIEDAKRIIKYALIGLFVIGISYGIVVALDKLIK